MGRFVLALLAALAAAPGMTLEMARIISLPTLLSELEGKPVTDFAGWPLGRVADLTLDLANGRVSHTIVQTPHGTRPVPFRVFTPSLDHQRLLLDASRERLAQAPEWIGGGELAGTLVDVVLDAHEGKVVFAVVRLAPGKLHPVPLRGFALAEELVLALDARDLERGRDFAPKELAKRLADADYLEKTAAYADRLAAAALSRR